MPSLYIDIDIDRDIDIDKDKDIDIDIDISDLRASSIRSSPGGVSRRALCVG
jgi:hypothetical protein